MSKYSFEPIEGFTVPVNSKPEGLEIRHVVISSAYLITNIGLEWANSDFVVHRVANSNIWRVSHKDTGASMGDFAEDYSILGAIDKIHRVLKDRGEKKYKEAVVFFEKMMEHAALGELKEYQKMASKRGYSSYG